MPDIVMGLIRVGNEIKKSRKVMLLDTAFILDYMPIAPEGYIKVYLAGLAFSMESGSSLEELSLFLNMPSSEVLEAFYYFERYGIVSVSVDPIEIEYLPVVPLSKQIAKFEKGKYKDFNDQLHLLFSGTDRVFTPLEYNEYYTVMELFNIQEEAMLMIVAYCKRLKGDKIRHNYITAVAQDLARRGIRTYDAINNHLSEIDLYDEELTRVYKALKVKVFPSHGDRSMLLKWKKEYGFTIGVICFVAKQDKVRSMDYLDKRLFLFYEKGISSQKQIEEYLEKQSQLLCFTEKFISALGIYERKEWALDYFISPWLLLGFSKDSLMVIAAKAVGLPYNKRQLQKIQDEIITVLYSKQLFTEEEISSWFENENKRTAIKKPPKEKPAIKAETVIEREKSPEELDKENPLQEIK